MLLPPLCLLFQQQCPDGAFPSDEIQAQLLPLLECITSVITALGIGARTHAVDLFRLSLEILEHASVPQEEVLSLLLAYIYVTFLSTLRPCSLIASTQPCAHRLCPGPTELFIYDYWQVFNQNFKGIYAFILNDCLTTPRAFAPVVQRFLGFGLQS